MIEDTPPAGEEQVELRVRSIPIVQGVVVPRVSIGTYWD